MLGLSRDRADAEGGAALVAVSLMVCWSFAKMPALFVHFRIPAELVVLTAHVRPPVALISWSQCLTQPPKTIVTASSSSATSPKPVLQCDRSS